MRFTTKSRNKRKIMPIVIIASRIKMNSKKEMLLFGRCFLSSLGSSALPSDLDASSWMLMKVFSRSNVEVLDTIGEGRDGGLLLHSSAVSIPGVADRGWLDDERLWRNRCCRQRGSRRNRRRSDDDGLASGGA